MAVIKEAIINKLLSFGEVTQNKINTTVTITVKVSIALEIKRINSLVTKNIPPFA